MTKRIALGAHSQEPHISRYLDAALHDIETTLAPEIQTDRGRSILDMVFTVLRHAAVRAEHATEMLSSHVRELLDALHALADFSGDRALVGECESRSAELSLDSAHETYRWVAGALEQLIATSLDSSVSDRATESTVIWKQVRRVIQAESDWYRLTEEREDAFRKRCSPQVAESSETIDSLTQYLRTRNPAAPDVKAARLLATLGGNSKDTLIVELAGTQRVADRIVIRRDVKNGPFDVTAVDEFEVLRALFGAGVPVARPLWIERDPRILGSPFIVTEFVEGSQAADLSTNLKAGESPRRAMLMLARILAQVHAVDVNCISGAEVIAGRPTRWHVSALIDLYEAQWRRRRLWYSPVLTTAFAWLKQNISQSTIRPAIIHGDASIRNLLIDHDGVGVLIDWETWHIGDPAEDVAYAEDEISPYMPFADFLASYYESGGEPVSPDRMYFWRIWRHLRNAVSAASMMEGTAYGSRPGVISPYSGIRWYRYTVQRLAELLSSLA